MVRAVRLSGVRQEDWHPKQILCIPSIHKTNVLPDHEDQFNFDLVFIDFAFATQNLGEYEGARALLDVYALNDVLLSCGISMELLHEYYDDPTEDEW